MEKYPNETLEEYWRGSPGDYVVKNWYGTWGDGVEYFLLSQCSDQLDNYLNSTVERFCLGETWCLFGTLMDCVLEQLPETWKANSEYDSAHLLHKAPWL